MATAVGEVVDSGMRAYIPYSLITLSPSNPWFDCACSSAISDREGAHLSYQASPSELTMLLLFLLGIAVLLRFVGPVNLSVKGKLISSTFLLKNVSGPYSKKSSTTSVTPAFPHLFALMAL